MSENEVVKYCYRCESNQVFMFSASRKKKVCCGCAERKEKQLSEKAKANDEQKELLIEVTE